MVAEHHSKPEAAIHKRSVMPIWIIVGVHSEVGPAKHFQIVVQAGMCNSKVVRRRVGRLGQLVDIGRIRVFLGFCL